AVFFTNDADADLNLDGTVNFADLGAMKAAFFQAPGPSAAAGCRLAAGASAQPAEATGKF
ncbi:MAG: hypothetical protein AAFN78_11355, partial [Pseudomonadota bacterium]